VIAPQDWDEQGKRQVNDKHDGLVMCRRLSEYLAGHQKALSIVRIPRRRRKLEGHSGACAAIMSADPADAGDGAQPSFAKGHGSARALVARENLETDSRGDAELGDRPVGDLEEAPGVGRETGAATRMELKKAAPRQLFLGESELTHELLARELIDPQRFAMAGRWATTLDFVRARAAARRADVWVRSPSMAIHDCVASWSSWLGGSAAFSRATEQCAVGAQSSTGRKPVPLPARKRSWRSRAASPSTFGGLPLVG
jgi:hypothetical protein